MNGASTVVAVEEPSQIGEARRAAVRLGARFPLSEDDVGRLSLVVTEAATNVMKHAGGGEIVLRADEQRAAVEILAIDRGPGIANVDAAMRDGHSTAGTWGAGLGGIRRLSDEFDLVSASGAGTLLLARVRASAGPPPTPPRPLGVVCVARDGEDICGDGWELAYRGDAIGVIVVDGVGHGIEAARATTLALELFRSADDIAAPGDLLSMMHARLRGTRGAAVAIAVADRSERIRFAGVGNVTATVVRGATTHGLVSHHGAIGYEARRFQEFVTAAPPGSMLVMHTDGIGSRWAPGACEQVRRHDPALLAAMLYRDRRRPRDDATALALALG